MLPTIFHTIFFAVIGVFTVASLLTMYVYIRYGRTLTITLASSAVFIVLFFIGAATAYATLQNLIDLYVQ